MVKRMKRKNLIIGVAAAAAVGGGTAGAIAATSGGKGAEQAVLADAAKRLGVGADELRTALSKAQDAQLDAAVKAGELTQAQADAIKERRRQRGSVLGIGRGGPGGPGGRGGFGHHGGGHFLLADGAKAIGISEAKLLDELRAGKTLAAIIEANGKTLAEVKAAVEKSATARLDAELKAGRITQAQRDRAVARLDDVIDRLGDARGGRFGRGGPGGPGFGHHGGGPFLLADAAKAIGISEAKLFERLRAGKTLTAVAKANGKTLAEVKAAVKTSATARLDAALKAGDITKAQRDEEVAELDEEIARLGDRRFGRFGRGGHGGRGFGHFGP